MLKGFSTIHCTEAANLIPRTGVWAVLNGLGSMDPDPHLVLGLSLTVFLHQLPELIHLTTLYFNEFIQLLSTQLLSTQLNDIGLCPSFWISTNQLTLIALLSARWVVEFHVND